MKKLYLSILYVVVISVLVSGTILFSKPQAGYNKSTYSHKINPVVSGTQNNSFIDFAKKHGNYAVRNQEKINVFNNAANLDLHVYLTENDYGLVTLNLAYKLDGKLVNCSIDATKIKEIRNIFNFREKYRNGYVIKNMLLNEKMKRLYFAVEGKTENKFYRTTLYSFDLENSHLEKIFYEVGVFGGFSISPNGKYNACSYSTCPQNISDNEKKTVIIFNSIDNKQVFDSSKDLITDKNSLLKDMYVYSYDFVKWQNNDTCELIQEIRAKDGKEKVMKRSQLYNLVSRKVTE